jgi:hypothetical protein
MQSVTQIKEKKKNKNLLIWVFVEMTSHFWRQSDKWQRHLQGRWSFCLLPSRGRWERSKTPRWHLLRWWTEATAGFVLCYVPVLGMLCLMCGVLKTWGSFFHLEDIPCRNLLSDNGQFSSKTVLPSAKSQRPWLYHTLKDSLSPGPKGTHRTVGWHV